MRVRNENPTRTEVEPGRKLIGLSLSLCIKDMLGNPNDPKVIKPDNVVKIVASTMAGEEREWDTLIAKYRRDYWSADPDKAEQICRLLLSEGRIEQPRLGDPYDIIPLNPGEHWLTEDQYRSWKSRRRTRVTL